MTTKRSRADKAIDQRIERAYYRTSNGVQIPIMSIPKIYRETKAAMSAATDDAALDAIVTEVVSRYRVN